MPRDDGRFTMDERGKDAMHGLNNTLQTLCPCGCGRMVRNVKNRNGRMRMFFDDKCRNRWYSRAREIGKGLMVSNLPAEDIVALIDAAKRLERGSGIIIKDKAEVEVRKKRQEHFDLDSMAPRERLMELARCAGKMMGILKKS